jgi:hypothetical protein
VVGVHRHPRGWILSAPSVEDRHRTFRNVLATEDGVAPEWATEDPSNGDLVTHDGVSILEIEDGKVRRFMAHFDTRRLTNQLVDLGRIR